MHALSQRHGTCSRRPEQSSSSVHSVTGTKARPTRSFKQPKQQLQVSAAISGLSAEARTTSAFTETWIAPTRRLPTQQEFAQQPRRPEQQTAPQQLRVSSSISRTAPLAVAQLPTTAPTPQASYQQPSNADLAREPPHQSNFSQTSSQSSQETLATAVDKMYRQRLREVKAMLTPESLQQLQQELSPEERQSLEVVLQDLQDLQGSWEEEDEQLNPAEQQLIQQVTSAAQIMPDDFNTYLMGMLPPGSGENELQELLQMLDDRLLQDIKSVYYELKEFEQTELELSVAQDRYIQLSGRISKVSARIQRTLQLQEQRQQREQQQQQHDQGTSYPSSSRNSRQQEAQVTIRQDDPATAVAGVSSSSSGRQWGSAWAKPHRSAASSIADVQQQQGLPPQQQQAEVPAAASQAQVPQTQPVTRAMSERRQQQQQQRPGVRQRRRRIIRRDTEESAD